MREIRFERILEKAGLSVDDARLPFLTILFDIGERRLFHQRSCADGYKKCRNARAGHSVFFTEGSHGKHFQFDLTGPDLLFKRMLSAFGSGSEKPVGIDQFLNLPIFYQSVQFILSPQQRAGSTGESQVFHPLSIRALSRSLGTPAAKKPPMATIAPSSIPAKASSMLDCFIHMNPGIIDRRFLGFED